MNTEPSSWFFSESTEEAISLAEDIKALLNSRRFLLKDEFSRTSRLVRRGGIYYLGPLREEPKDTYHVKGERFSWVGIRGERTVDILVHNTEIVQKIGEWLVKHSLATEIKPGRGRTGHYGIKVENLRRGTDAYAVYLCDNKTGWKIDIKNVGFGYSQIMPILAGAFVAPEDSLIILEQPEIHLNPAVIPPMVELFAESVSQGKNFLIETHSEILLLALQYLVAKGEIPPKKVLIYFTERTPDGSECRKITIGPKGDLSGDWPKDFFSDDNRLIYQRYKELIESK